MEFPEKIDPEAVFATDSDNAADFEIAFTALVATTVLSTPIQTVAYDLVKGLVVLLTILTLLRKMAIVNGHKSAKPVLYGSFPVILMITYLAITHLLLQFGGALSGTLPLSVSPVAYAAAVTPLFAAFVFSLQSYLFGDFALYLALISFNGSTTLRNNSAAPNRWADWLVEQASIFVSVSSSEQIPPKIRWLEHYSDESLKGPRKTILAVAIMVYGGLWAVITYFLGSGFLTLLFLSMLIVLQYPILFWYSRYGLARYHLDRGGTLDVVSIVISLLGIHFIMIPEYTSVLVN